MAVPTITSITPNEGKPIGGYIARIAGTNFELPPDPPSPGWGSVPETVEVLFGSVLATDVRVWSSSDLTCIVPEYDLNDDFRVLNADPGVSVDVTVSNLTDPITETVTETDGFTYKRTNLARGMSTLAYVCRCLRRRMATDIIENVVLRVRGIDYYDPSAVSVYLASTPGIAIIGPGITEDIDYRVVSPRPKEEDLVNLRFNRYARPFWSRLSFSASLVSRGNGAELEILNLMNDFISFFNEKKWLDILTDPTDPTSDIARLSLKLTVPPDTETAVSRQGIAGATAAFEVGKVPIDRDSRVVVESGRTTEDDTDLETDITVL